MDNDRDKMMFCPSDVEGSTYDSIQATTVYWKNAGDGRVDRMVSRANLETANAIANVYFEDVYLHFEYVLLATSIERTKLNSIRDPAFQKLATFGTYNIPALASSLAAVLKEDNPQKAFAQLVYELDLIYHDLLTEQYGELFSMQIPWITDDKELPSLIEGILKLY